MPGGTEALSRAITLETTPDPARFVTEVIRILYANPDATRDQVLPITTELQRHLAVVERLQSAIDAAPQAGWSLSAAASRTDRQHLEDVLDVIGLKLRQNRGRYTVEREGDREAAERVRILGELGLDVTDVDERLNAGETVGLTIPSEPVPVPLDADIWSRAVFKATVTPAHLFAAIMSNPKAALLCHGLAALDDDTMTFLAQHPALVTRLYEEDAAVFASLAGRLRIRNGRVVMPGGDEAVPLWESLLDEKATNPEPFVHELMSRSEGRLAYLFDTIAELDAPRQAFALGLWIADPRVRVEQFRALAGALTSAFPEWQIRSVPFRRPIHDFAELALAVRVDPRGVPLVPAQRKFWSHAFSSSDLSGEPEKELKDIDEDGPVDAGWLAEAVLMRKDREQLLRQLAFGFRAFQGAAPPLGDVLFAVRGMATYPALMATLERLGAVEPSLYVALARRAHAVDQLDGDRLFLALRQFQGAVALVVHMYVSGGMAAKTADFLLRDLAAVPLESDGAYMGRVAAWLSTNVLPAIETRETSEASVVAALAGSTHASAAAARRIEWEGQRYRVDVALSEERRMLAVRQRQESVPLDASLQIFAAATALAARSAQLSDIQSAAEQLKAIAAALPPRPRNGDQVLTPGVGPLMNTRETLDRAVKELARITKPRDARKAADVAAPLNALVDVMLGDALAAILYAADLGDPEGPTLLGGDVSRRHDFGFREVDAGRRQRTRWARPTPEVEMETPWHLRGSLLGLDVALGRLSMKRLDLDAMPPRPLLPSNDREGFIHTYALMNPSALHDDDAAAIASALARGAARVAAARDPAAAAVLAGEVEMDGWRARALAWTAAHDPARTSTFFSLPELMVLAGQDHLSRFDAWGASRAALDGCLCVTLTPSRAWRLVIGRQQLGLLGVATPDLNLRIAALLTDLQVPAVLAKSVASAAMLNYVDNVRPNHPDDWLSLVRGVGDLTREQVEDYVAAAAADGPLIPDTDAADTAEAKGPVR